MANKPTLVDQWNRPIKRATLKQEIAAPTFGGVRSPIAGYPADGLNPVRLASILREADMGDPVRYMELAETIEERDPHYLGVIATRKRSVSQIDITVEPGSDDPADLDKAEMVREWLKRDELTDEVFDILDGLGKGYSFTEILWDTSEGQWRPDRLERRDQRWFRFAQHDLQTPMMLGESGQEEPLPGFKFIYARMKAKSGLPLRSGLARVAAWGWMFKAFTQRDWAIFTQTFGQPLRIGKYGAGASEADKNTLFHSVANIAGDCAAIIPDSMNIDFVETKNLGASADLYEKRSDWLDRQISKAVLGQTATTDAVTGGLGSGKEHREVQEDIERADAKALQAILNTQLIRPWMDLEYGPQKKYPRLIIARAEQEDLKAFSDAVAPLITVGLRVRQSEVLDKFGLSEPKAGDKILGPNPVSAPNSPDLPPSQPPRDPQQPLRPNLKGYFMAKAENNDTVAAQAEEGAPEAPTGDLPVSHIMGDRLLEDAAAPMEDMLGQIEAMLETAGSIDEFRERLLAGFPKISSDDLAAVIGKALFAADAGGRATLEDESA